MSRIATPNFGWAMEHEDRAFLSRFVQQMPRAFKSVTIPDRLRYDWLRVEDQGRIGSCQGHGLSSGCEVLYFVATGQVIQLSRLFAYLRTQKEDGLLGSDVGSTIAGGIRVATTIGLPLEELAPYDGSRYPSDARIREILSPENEAAALPFLIRSGVKITSFDDAIAWVAGGGVISLGRMYDHERDADCIVHRWRPTGRGGHATLIAEIEDGMLGDIGSWGMKYLREGRQYWKPDAFNAMLRDPSSAVMGLSDLAQPRPRKIDFGKEVWKK